MVFSDAGALVGIVYIACRLINSNGFYFLSPFECAEAAEQLGLHLSIFFHQTILPQIAAIGAALAADDGCKRAIGRLAVEPYAHRRPNQLPFKDRYTAAVDKLHIR